VHHINNLQGIGQIQHEHPAGYLSCLQYASMGYKCKHHVTGANQFTVSGK
jgi:hypothetical protein